MFSPMTIAALAMPLLALAAPVSEAAAPKKFLIKAHVPKAAHPSSHSKFEGTYLQFYHTGAGFNDVAFGPGAKDSTPAFINKTDSSLQFNAGEIRYGLDFHPEAPYTSWQPAYINVGESDNQFFINATGVQAKGDFGGWVICDWWHGVPQLFHYFKGYETPLSQSCEFVQLLPEYIS